MPLSDERIEEILELARQVEQDGTLALDAIDTQLRAIEYTATAPLLAQIAALEVQLAEARKDAERYRWLKNECNDKGTTGTYIARELFGFEWNRAIDAAIAQEQ